MTNDEHIKLLKAIRDLALLPYPYPGDAPRVDDRLPFALGQIAGIAIKALHDVLGREEESEETTWPPP